MHEGPLLSGCETLFRFLLGGPGIVTTSAISAARVLTSLLTTSLGPPSTVNMKDSRAI